MTSYIDGEALLRVLATSLLAGVGLVGCFALGLVGLSIADARRTGAGIEDGTAASPATVGDPGTLRVVAGRTLAGISFAVVLGGIAFGVLVLLKT